MVRTDTWLDSVASIRHITSQGALFTFKDGTARRLPVRRRNVWSERRKRRNGSQSTQTGCSHYTPYAMSVVLPEWSL
jgi:hypothetical protein